MQGPARGRRAGARRQRQAPQAGAARLRPVHQGLPHLQPLGRPRRHLGDRAPELHPARARPRQGLLRGVAADGGGRGVSWTSDDDSAGLPLPEGLDIATLEFTLNEWRLMISKEPTLPSLVTSVFIATLHEDDLPTRWAYPLDDQLNEVPVFTMDHGPVGDVPRWATGTLAAENGRIRCHLF